MRTKKICALAFILAAVTLCTRSAAVAESDEVSKFPQFMSDLYQEKDVSIAFHRAYSKTDNYGSKFCIELNVKVLAQNKILKPERYAYGIYVLDNFGNDLDVSDMVPRNCDSLRPGEERLFIITFNIRPLKNTKYLLIQLPKGIFGNKNSFELTIFNTGAKGPITKEERDRLEAGAGAKYWQEGSASIDFKPDDTQIKKLDKIFYTAIFVGLCAFCSLVMILVFSLKTAKETVLRGQSFLPFFAHWLNQSYRRLLAAYLFSALISCGWLIFGVIVIIAGHMITAENIFAIIFFLSSWLLLSFLSFLAMCEVLSRCRALDHY